MRKKLYAIIFVVIMLFTLFGCNAGFSSEETDNQDLGESQSSVDILIFNQTNRKIVYTVDAEITADDFDTTVQKIYDAMDEVPEDLNSIVSSSIDNSGGYKYARLSLKIKTTSLELFLTKLEQAGKQTSRTINSEDITYSYARTEARIDALTEEKALYNGLIADEDDAAVKAVYIKELREINAELALLSDTLSKYDSAVEYSTVNISIRSAAQETPGLSFGQRIRKAFIDSFSFIWKAIKWLFVAFVYVMPFAVIIGGITIGVLFLKKAMDKKKQKEKTKAESKAVVSGQTEEKDNK